MGSEQDLGDKQAFFRAQHKKCCGQKSFWRSKYFWGLTKFSGVRKKLYEVKNVLVWEILRAQNKMVLGGQQFFWSKHILRVKQMLGGEVKQCIWGWTKFVWELKLIWVLEIFLLKPLFGENKFSRVNKFVGVIICLESKIFFGVKKVSSVKNKGVLSKRGPNGHYCGQRPPAYWKSTCTKKSTQPFWRS